MEGLIPEFAAYGVVRERSGNEIPGVAPSNTYPCRDGDWVVIGGNADNLFHRLMIGIGRPDLAADERFRDNRGRARHSALLDAAISEFTSTRSLAEVMAVMVAAEVPAGPIYSAAEMAEDPHFQARDMLLACRSRSKGSPRRCSSPASCPSSASSRAGCAGWAPSSASTPRTCWPTCSR